MRRSFFSLLFLICFGCGHIGIMSKPPRSTYYRSSFLREIKVIKSLYHRGENDMAMKRLDNFVDSDLWPDEVSMKYNLIGVIHFSKKEYEQAILYFDKALANPINDSFLKAQVLLNLGSTYFRQNDYSKAGLALTDIDYQELGQEEVFKFFYLVYLLSDHLDGKPNTHYLIQYFKKYHSLNRLKSDPLFPKLKYQFLSIPVNDRQDILLKDGHKEEDIVIVYLALLDAENRFYMGNRGEAEDLITWLKDDFLSNDEARKLILNYEFKIKNFYKINPYSVGLILPFSGRKKEYSQKITRGIDAALTFESQKEHFQGEKELTIHYQDSQGSGVIGAFRVQELVKNYSVSIIIGGATHEEALSEYLEARKYGVIFISLSQIFLPNKEKDYLLIELPGSIESQINRLTATDTLEMFGKNMAIIYPKGHEGESYVDEFWEKSLNKDFKIVSLQAYLKNSTDFRTPVKHLLGLRYPRERQEEFDLLSEIFSYEENVSIRRIQTLSPVIDFDWIYVAASPSEAQKLVPTFKYFDASNIVFFGGPSWRSKLLSRISTKGPLYFVSDDLEQIDIEFESYYTSRYGRSPRLIDVMSCNAMHLVFDILTNVKISNRADLHKNLQEKDKIKGLFGDWKLTSNHWTKKMSVFKFYRGKIEKILN